MSVKTINNIISTFCVNMKIDIHSIIIKIIEIDDNCLYNARLEFNDELYSIRHYEPNIMIEDVNYGMGYYHDYDIFDKQNKVFTRLKI